MLVSRERRKLQKSWSMFWKREAILYLFCFLHDFIKPFLLVVKSSWNFLFSGELTFYCKKWANAPLGSLEVVVLLKIMLMGHANLAVQMRRSQVRDLFLIFQVSCTMLDKHERGEYDQAATFEENLGCVWTLIFMLNICMKIGKWTA